MSIQNLSNIQGVNELLSGFLVGVPVDQNFIADQVLPPIPVRTKYVTYRKVGNEALYDFTESEVFRAPGTMPNNVDVSLGTDTASLHEAMLKTGVDIAELQEAENAQDQLDIRLNKFAVPKSGVLIVKEKAVASAIFTAGNYGANTSSAVGFGGTGIRTAIRDAKRTIQKKSGVNRGFKLVLGPLVEAELLDNADIMAAIQYRQFALTTLEIIAQYLEVDQVLVGDAITQTAETATGEGGTGSYIWTEDSAALIHSPTLVGRYSKSFAKLFQAKYAQTNSLEFAQLIHQNALIEEWGYGQHFGIKISSAGSGFLWTNADQ